MRKLFLLIVLLVLVGFGWLRQSIYWTLVGLERAAEAGDVATVEKYADLGAVVEGGGVFAEVAAEEGARDATGSDLVGKIAGALTRGVAGAVVEATKGDAELEMRRKIARGEAFSAWGPFTPDAEDPLRAKERLGDTWLVDLRGTCSGHPASVEVIFTRVPGLLDQPLLGHWRATELRRDSLVALAKACAGG